MTALHSILLVADEPGLARALKAVIERAGYGVELAATASAAEAALTSCRFEVALLDLASAGEALGTLAAMAKQDPALPILFVVGRNEAPLALRALRAGAADFLTRPLARADVLLAIDNARKRALVRQRLAVHRAGRSAGGVTVPLPIGSSALWQRALELVCAAARSSRTPILLTGEPGSGKEVLASLLHRLSPRSPQPFITTSIASLPPRVIETELFGHEAGAFTDARQPHRGLLERASGATLFLDDICELTVELQGKLLRALEGQPFRRIGGTREIRSDVRLLCASRRPLRLQVQAGLVHPELYERLRVFEIPVPALRERREDIPELAAFFVERLGTELNLGTPPISAQALTLLAEHPWPGNVRALRDVVERALLQSAGGEILPAHLPLESATALVPPPGPLPQGPAPRRTSSDELLQQHITSVFEAAGRNMTKAAAMLGMSRLALRKRLVAYGFRTVA